MYAQELYVHSTTYCIGVLHLVSAVFKQIIENRVLGNQGKSPYEGWFRRSLVA